MKSLFRIGLARLGLISLLTSLALPATALVYDEGTDGDLGSSFANDPDPIVLPFDPGFNTVAGEVSCNRTLFVQPGPFLPSFFICPVLEGADPVDAFIAQTPRGFQITSAFLLDPAPQAIPPVVGPPILPTVTLRQNGTVISSVEVPLKTSVVPRFVPLIRQPIAGDVLFEISAVPTARLPQTSTALTYFLIAEVAPIPLPAGLPLLASALLGLGLLHRYRASSTA